MGTETIDFLWVHRACSYYYCVKLNNPLMGTETHILYTGDFIAIIADVKLNNPLMGTETLHWNATGSAMCVLLN